MANEVFLGSVYGTLEMRTEKWESGVEQAKKKLNDLETTTSKQLTAIGDKFTSIGTKLSLGLTTPILAFGASAVKAGIDMDTAMKQVEAISGATGDEIKVLRDLALEFGRKGSFSTEQVAQAMIDMVRDGLSPAQISGGQLAAAYDLAAASGTDLYQTQIALSNAMAVFGYDTADASTVSEVFNKVLNATQLELDEFAETMRYAGPIANNLGIGIEDLSTAIGIMGESGIKASVAGTSLRGGLLRLVDPPKEAQEALNALGVELFDTQGKMKPMPQIINDLNKSMEGYTDQQRAAATSAIFGVNAVSGWTVLLREGLSGWDAMEGKMTGVSSTSEIAAKRQEGLAFALKELSAAMYDFRLAISDTLEPMLVPFTNRLSDLLFGFKELPDPIKNATVALGGFAAAIGPVFIGLGSMFKILGFATGGWKTFFKVFAPLGKLIPSLATMAKVFTLIGTAAKAAFAFMLSPAGLVIIALAAIAAAVYLIWKNWDVIYPKLLAVWASIQTKMAELGQWVRDTFTSFWQGIVTFFTSTLPTAFTNFVTFLASIPGRVIGFLVQLPGMILNAMGQMILAAVTGLGFLLGVIVFGLAEIVVAAADWVYQMALTVGNWFATLPERIGLFLTNTYNKFVEWGNTVLTFITVTIPQWINSIVLYLSSLPGRVWEWLVATWQRFVQWGNDTWAYLSTNVPIWINNVVTWLSELPGKAWNALVGLKDMIVQRFTETWTAIVEEVSTWPGRLLEWGKKIAQAFVDGIKQGLVALKDAFVDGLNKARDFVQGKSPPKLGPFRHIDVWGFNVGMAWVEGMQSAISGLELGTPAIASSGGQVIERSGSISNNTSNFNRNQEIHVHVGAFLGTQMEVRAFARQINQAIEQDQKGRGETING